MAKTLAKFFGPGGVAREPQTLWERVSAPFRLATYRAATEEEWEEWTTNSKRDHPFLYWLNWDLPTGYRVWKRRLITDPYWWVRYRTTDRNHVLKMRSMQPGYMDRSEIILHANFQLLVDFVEQELPCRNYEWFEQNGVKHRSGGRYPEAALAYMDWEINEPDCQVGTPGMTQADGALARKELYLWWTRDRPRRMEAWSDTRIWPDRSIEALTDLTTSFLGQYRQDAGRMAMHLEEIHSAEDQNMLMKLIQHRQGMWT